MQQKNQMAKKEQAAVSDKSGEALFQRQVVFEGSVPHPDILKGYGEVNETFPERIIQIAENHAKTEDAAQRALVKGNIVSVILGQFLSFIFGVVGIAATVYLGIKGNTACAVWLPLLR